METEMQHTTLKDGTPRFAFGRHPRARGVAVVALGALALASGCGGGDESSPIPAQAVAGQQPADMMPASGAPAEPGAAPAPGSGSTNEGNPNATLGPSTAGASGEQPFVENSGADCEVAGLPTAADLTELSTLPDPFTGLNGERLTSKAQWRCRRQEILKLAETFIYGEKPGKPESVTGTVTSTSLTVNVTNQGQSASFTAAITLPADATGPVPAIIGYGGSSFQNTILGEGVAFINFQLASVGDETTRNPKTGAFYTVNPDHADTGMLVAWAWGVSRMIDVLEASDAQLIDARAIGVHGCSRSGKGAFIAGAFDERVALTLPFESGMAGVPAFRMIVPEGGEVLRNAYEYRPWAGDAYLQFLVLGAPQTDMAALAAQNEQSGQLQFRLPLDTHEVMGMVAPRGMFVMGNPHIVNLAPRSENITVQAGAQIYSALGVAENLTYLSNITDGTHCAFRQEFVEPLQQNIRKFLKKDATATTGSLDAHSNIAAELAPSVAWETPVLE
jgi:hypothetical protein